MLRMRWLARVLGGLRLQRLPQTPGERFLPHGYCWEQTSEPEQTIQDIKQLLSIGLALPQHETVEPVLLGLQKVIADAEAVDESAKQFVVHSCFFIISLSSQTSL